MDCFPPEILEKVLGSLDMRTLCTARLICKTLSTAASRWVHTIRVSAEYLREHPDTSFSHFPCLAQVAIAGVLIEDLPLLASPAVAHAVTDVEIQLIDRPPSDSSRGPRPTLPHLPKVRSLEIRRFGIENDFYFPASLQELVLRDWVCSHNGDAVLRLTGLTNLNLTVHDRLWSRSDHSFEELTTLTALRKLQIGGLMSILPCVAALPLLTHLDWACQESGNAPPLDLAPLTRLPNLVHLGVNVYLEVGLTPGSIRSIGLLTGLRSLKLRSKRVGLVDLDATLLTPLSRLTKLSLDEGCMDLASLRRMNIEGLQDLALMEPRHSGPEVTSLLQRATGLEHLHFAWSYGFGRMREAGPLVLALSQMSRLQSLRLAPGWLGYSCFQAIGLLAGLTSLHYSESEISPADVEECARLTNLRTLTLLPDDFSPSGPITSDEFLALAMLPELKSLVLGKQLGFWGYPATHDFADWYNGPRHCKGWPPLELEFVK
jgi:hypothetical protein